MTSRAYPPPTTTQSRASVLLLVGALLVLAALLPAAMWLDRGLDEDRKMYLDRQDMAWIQHQRVLNDEEPVALELYGAKAEIGAVSFEPRDGVTVEVTTETEKRDGEPFYSYCVRAGNEDGEQTPWLCHDADHPPSQPTGDPLATG